MSKNENIFVKLQIEREPDTKALSLYVTFDKNAPNFSLDQNGIYWLPTIDEIDFIVEAFGILSHTKLPERTWNKDEEDEEEEPPLPLPTVKIEEHEHSPYEKKIGVSAYTRIDEETERKEEYHPKNKDNVEKIFIQADAKTIDEVIKRRKVPSEEDYVANPNDRSVLDRMLKQKKKK